MKMKHSFVKKYSTETDFPYCILDTPLTPTEVNKFTSEERAVVDLLAELCKSGALPPLNICPHSRNVILLATDENENSIRFTIEEMAELVQGYIFPNKNGTSKAGMFASLAAAGAAMAAAGFHLTSRKDKAQEVKQAV